MESKEAQIQLISPMITMFLIGIGYFTSSGYVEGLQAGFGLAEVWLWVDAGVSTILFLVSILIILAVTRSSPWSRIPALLSASWLFSLVVVRITSLGIVMTGQESENPVIFILALIACEVSIYALKGQAVKELML